MYEMGDLSGKYGYLNGKNMYSFTGKDMNVPLYGPHSSLGRSIVLHANDGKGSRLVCANIEPKDATKLSGVANFTANPYSVINGYVRMVRESWLQIKHNTAQNVSVFGVILVRIFPHSD